MKQVIQNYRTGEIALREVPAPALRPGTVLVRNVASVVSVGTEKLMTGLARKSLVGKAVARPDLVKRVVEKARAEGVGEAFRQAMSRLDAPVPLGYSCAGRIVAVGPGADGLAAGHRVACGGHAAASHAEIVRVPHTLCVAVPDGVEFDEAAFAFIGAIALHTVRMAEVVLGERVAVIGLGLLGQIAAQIVRAAGAEAFAVDRDESRVALALELGARGGAMAGGDALSRAERFTGGRGFDAVLVFASTPGNQPVEAAVEMARERGRIAVAGMVRMDMPRSALYEKELRVIVPRSAGPGADDAAYEGKGLDYPPSYVPWTEKRNMEAFLALMAAGSVRVRPLVTHRIPIESALQAYALLSGERQEPYLGVVLTHNGDRPASLARRLDLRKQAVRRDAVRIGVVGAGLFASTVLLPLLRKVVGVAFTGLATTGGVSAEHAARKLGFGYCATDADAVLEDPHTDAVLILTRHGSHADLVCRALSAGKCVFVEKPLATDESQLARVADAYGAARGRLMVGFNRRFAPLAREAKGVIGDAPRDLVVVCRVNAGFLAPDHWVRDEEEGCGRIIGEVCHFVDLVQHLAGAPLVRVFAERTAGEPDNVCATLALATGAIGTIVYTASGSRGFPRERVEAFTERSVCVIDDFRRGRFAANDRRWRRGGMSVDRGHRNELEAFVGCLRSGDAFPVPLADYVNTTRATFAIEESLREGQPALVEP